MVDHLDEPALERPGARRLDEAPPSLDTPGQRLEHRVHDEPLDIDEGPTGAAGDVRELLARQRHARPVEAGHQQNGRIEIQPLRHRGRGHGDLQHALIQETLDFSQERVGQSGVVDGDAQPEALNCRVVLAEPLAPDLERSTDSFGIVEQRLQEAALTDVHDRRGVAFHVIPLRAEDQHALALGRKPPGRGQGQFPVVAGKGCPARLDRRGLLKEARNERPIILQIEGEPG